MINDLAKIKNELRRNQKDLAFVVGNGINRYAYSGNQAISWDELLLGIWRQLSIRTLSDISTGISLTEFYDVMEMETNSIEEVKLKVVEFIKQWKQQEYHKWLQSKAMEWDVPLLTTNFDRNLDVGLKKQGTERAGFSDVYPWKVYFSNKELACPTDGFGVWHINGILDYRRSIRLGLTEYVALLAKGRSFLHKKDETDDFKWKNQSSWNGNRTWLHIIFNCSLCVFGLALDENETFLRWLLIERAKYFRKYSSRKKWGWYVCKSEELSEGKRFYLESVGFEIVKLDNWDDIYEKLIDR